MHISTRLLATAIAAAVLTAVSMPARAQQPDTSRGVRIGLTYERGTLPRILVLAGSGPAADSTRAILQRDFEYGHRVSVVVLDSAELRGVVVPGRAMDYSVLQRLGAAAVVQVTTTAAGLHVALHDVAQRKVAAVEDLPVTAPYPSRAWRWALHGAADLVTSWITGERGIAQTRIAFERGRQLWVVDSDGEGEMPIPTGGEPPMSPAWHPDGTQIAYNTYGAAARVMLYDLRTRRSRTASTTGGGVNQTPSFSADGRWLVYAHGAIEGTDLYLVPAAGGSLARRITVARGIVNVSPSWSPDSRRLAFTSNRSGQPEVYIMDADGTNADLLTTFVFGEESYQSNPDWSPDGRMVAYQSRLAGRFQLRTINLRDRSVRQLTDAGSNEDPSWSPDSRHLVFVSTRTGTRQLWVLDTETNEARQLTRTGGARMPAWSRRTTAY